MHEVYNWLKFMEHSRFYGFISIKAIENKIKKINQKSMEAYWDDFFFIFQKVNFNLGNSNFRKKSYKLLTL